MKHLSLVLISFLALLNCSCLKPVRIEGTAMEPTLKDSDRVLLNTNIGELERGDIIAFLYPKNRNKWYLKRIVALPGDKIEIVKGTIFINGEKLDEPYLDERYNSKKEDFPVEQVAGDNYYVLGDNRDNSSDSRYWGTVSKDLIQGKYYTTYIQADKK